MIGAGLVSGKLMTIEKMIKGRNAGFNTEYAPAHFTMSEIRPRASCNQSLTSHVFQYRIRSTAGKLRAKRAAGMALGGRHGQLCAASLSLWGARSDRGFGGYAQRRH
eukprot:2180831-Pleurochrysis_carterae.AAC.1